MLDLYFLHLDSDTSNRCYYCGQTFRRHPPNSPHKKSRDHIFPKSQYEETPFVYCCMGCNTSKGDLPLMEFWRRIKTAQSHNRRFRKIPRGLVPVVEKNIQKLIEQLPSPFCIMLQRYNDNLKFVEPILENPDGLNSL